MLKKLRVFIYIAVCQVSGIIGTVFTGSKIESWYLAELIRPSFAPPNWLFGPVWIILYTLMGIAWYLVWCEKKSKLRTQGLWMFGIQLVLNALWTPIFFGAQALALSSMVIVLLWGSIIATMYFFYHIKKITAYILIPYLVWVSFASVLNIAIWVLN